jgi:hypothetical protein
VTVMHRAMWGALCVWLSLGATAAEGELRDLGSFGATCPVPPARPAVPERRVRLEPTSARVPERPGAALPIATARRTYTLAREWPPGAPELLAVVGTDPVSLAVVRALPARTPVLVVGGDAVATVSIQRACPVCVVSVSGAEGASALGIGAVPSVLRVVDGRAQVTEGPP